MSEETTLASDTSDDRKKLLIVEDNQDFRHFLKEQLSETYQVIDAPDGEEGEKLAVEQNPDLIISDIMMPKVDGLELCRRIKHNVQTSHIPVILLTARSGDEAKISGYAVGADSYISKPFSFDVLLARIKQLIEQQEGRRKEFRKTLRVNPSRITRRNKVSKNVSAFRFKRKCVLFETQVRFDQNARTFELKRTCVF